jgi:hypothetical protein
MGCLLGLSCFGPGSAAAGVAAMACGPARARTLASDRAARVYAVHEKVYGCARGSHSRYQLGARTNSMSEGRVGPIALAGVDVAFGRATFGVDVVSAEVVVENLTDGHVLHDEAATASSVGPEYAQQVHSIVVKPDGSVAWIASISSFTSRRSATEVRKSDRTGRTALDRSQSIRPDSLRLHRSELTWRDGSTRKSATLR